MIAGCAGDVMGEMLVRELGVTLAAGKRIGETKALE